MKADELLRVIATTLLEVEVRGDAIDPADAAACVGYCWDLLAKYGPEIDPHFNWEDKA